MDIIKKQIIENEGYLTHAITDGDGNIYGISESYYISDWDLPSAERQTFVQY